MERQMNNMIADHEYPWISSSTTTFDMKCDECGEMGRIDDWVGFLIVHKECADPYDYPRSLATNA